MLSERILPKILSSKLGSIKQNIIKESLEVKLPTIWTDEKQRWEESEERREERRSQKRKSQKKEDPGARKVQKWPNTVFFQ